MKTDMRYLKNENQYWLDAAYILGRHFSSPDKFHEFYAALPSPEAKNELLRICSFYRYTVKDGHWSTQYDGEATDVDYITSSYKLLFIFALIESLGGPKHVDFYEWLHKRKDVFPIDSPKNLADLHREYKAVYGSIRRITAFFKRLDSVHAKRLCDLIKTNGKSLASIDKFSMYLYEMRSKFAHEGEFALAINGGFARRTLSIKKKIISSMRLEDIYEAFELGVIAHFRSVSTQ